MNIHTNAETKENNKLTYSHSACSNMTKEQATACTCGGKTINTTQATGFSVKKNRGIRC